MDAYEATKAVFSRIQSLDKENASKIMGLLLIQDHGEKDMIRLAFGPQNLLHSLVVKARLDLGISSNTPFHPNNTQVTNFTRQYSVGSSACSSRFLHNSEFASPCSVTNDGVNNLASKSTLNPCSPPFYGSGGGQLSSFVNDNCPTISPNSSDMFANSSELLGNSGVGDPMFNGVSNAEKWSEALPHRRSCSVSDINLGSCSSRGFHKRGCEVSHMAGPPSKIEMIDKCHELLRSKSMQQQKFMAYSINKGLSLFGENQQNVSPRNRNAALMMEGELHKFSRPSRGFDNCRADLSPPSRQIYLTFPSDSIFREEDVSSYFSIFGPVQDVRIPYQQKRMFGFVTFMFAETVKIILAKGNPHFVCDSRVLVKPYKEKGKIPDKFRKRGEFPSCDSPTTIDSRDPFNLSPGARMIHDEQTQYMLWKRKLEEEADFQQALELQRRKLMGLQLHDIKRNNHHRSFSTDAHSIHSPTQSPSSTFHYGLLGSERSSPDASDEICESPPPLDEAKQALQQTINEVTDREKEGSVGEEGTSIVNGSESPCRLDGVFKLPESLEHNLPDSPFASPGKKCDELKASSLSSTTSRGSCEVDMTSIQTAAFGDDNSKISPFLPSSPALEMASFQSCYFQMPRFSPGNGTIGL